MVHISRGGSRTAATSKVELFVIIVNGWKPLTMITNSSTLDVTAVLDPPLIVRFFCHSLLKLDDVIGFSNIFPSEEWLLAFRI